MPAYIGQIMAECDCESQLCLELGRCMAEGQPRCRSCKITMQPGRALQPTWVGGELDFPGDEHPVTFSAGGPGKMTDCWKCPQCGRSIER
jgi:hypothetical protein